MLKRMVAAALALALLVSLAPAALAAGVGYMPDVTAEMSDPAY